MAKDVDAVLMIAYHFPPIRHSSGIQRTLKFASYLGNFGWRPIVLTVHPRAYELTGDDQLKDIPEDIVVHRAFALDAKRHLTLFGRYPSCIARPDRYSSWMLGAVPAGLRIIRRHRPRAIWSTYPIATAQTIGYLLHRITGLPWVADLRDPMIDADYPVDPTQRRWHAAIERRVVQHADRVVLTTPSLKCDYAARYPEVPDERWVYIPNGYDETVFTEIERASKSISRSSSKLPLKLIHTGVLYPDERDPTALFTALGELKRQGSISSDTLRISLRATGHDELYHKMIVDRQISDIVELAPAIAYREALSEMLNADGLLLLQSSSCNRQIPAKLYEYLRAKRPILALTDKSGDTAATLRDAGLTNIATLDDPKEIERELMRFCTAIETGNESLCDQATIKKYSRFELTERLANLLTELRHNQ